MEEKKINELIIVEQLPKITQQLEMISKKIDKEVEYALSLECNEESKVEVKQERAKINKIKTTLEERRKEVKQAVMNPYNEFESIYNDLVKNKLNEADNTLKSRIDEIESIQKKEKEEELREFVRQHCEANNLDLKFETIGLNITLSSSLKSLKEQALDFINKVVNDMKLIELEEYRAEILVEYNKNYNFADSKMKVVERHKEMKLLEDMAKSLKEKEEQQAEMIEKINEAIEVAEELEIQTPKEIIMEEDTVTVSFTITDTKSKIIALRDYMRENDIHYE